MSENPFLHIFGDYTPPPLGLVERFEVIGFSVEKLRSKDK